MKYLELQEIDIPVGKEWESDRYPGLGMYLLKSGIVVINYMYDGGTLPCVTQLGRNPFPFKTQETFPFDGNNPGTIRDDREAIIPLIRDDHRVGVNDLLKAIAISQNPELAKELCK